LVDSIPDAGISYRTVASWYLYRAVDLENAAGIKSKGK
jgi:hypothetical protein